MLCIINWLTEISLLVWFRLEDCKTTSKQITPLNNLICNPNCMYTRDTFRAQQNLMLNRLYEIGPRSAGIVVLDPIFPPRAEVLSVNVNR